ncbi:MAG: hypothetical protein M1608_15960 [Candidatus Omnitrophica bacterium]|nr:hypothetical protein [Candidatus Omnitrophota bacterium]
MKWPAVLALIWPWAVGNIFGAEVAVSSVVAWGDNRTGQTNVPSDLTNAVAIAAGENHSLALKSDGMIVAWGTNDYGQLQIPWNLTNVVAIAAGGEYSTALQRDGTLLRWNGYGNLQKIAVGSSNISVLACCSPYGLLVVQVDGRVVGWGSEASKIPPGLSNVVSVAARVSHRLALLWNGSPWITAPPSNQVAYLGTTTQFSVQAIGAQSMRFQWQHNGENIPGATNAVPILTDLSRNQAGEYQVIIDNPLGETVSDRVVLEIREVPPAILRQPEFRTVVRWMTIPISVTAEGPLPLSYQWQFNGADLAGATNPVLTLTDVQLTNRGSYRVVITNAFGTTTSSNAVVEVVVVAAWGNNTYGQTNGPMDMTNVAAIAAGAGSLHYQWLQNGDIIPGATNATLIIGNLAPIHSGDYQVRIRNTLGETLSPLARLTTADALPTIVQQPQNVQVVKGFSARLKVTVEGTADKIPQP